VERAIEFRGETANDEPVGEHARSLAANGYGNFRCSESEKPLDPFAGCADVTLAFVDCSELAPSKLLNRLLVG
jgi:hypothetical protein